MNRDLRPRLDLNKMQTNVIMSQIRAEKQKSSIKLVQHILIPPKQRVGKRHFQRNLCQVTDITNLHLNQQQRTSSISTGKRMMQRSVSLNNLENTSRSQGKKKFQDKARQSAYNPIVVKKVKNIHIQQPCFGGKRRFDHSPNHQQRESRNSPLNWNKNIF